MAPPSPLVVASALAGGVTGLLGIATLLRRDEPGSTSFALLMLGATIWSLSYAAGLLVFDATTRRLFELPVEVGKALIAPAWLLFALGYTGRGQFLTRRFVAAVMAIPALTLALTATNASHHLMWRNYHVVEVAGAATAAYRPGPWFYLHAAYGYVLVAIGLFLVLETLLAREELYREQVLALAAGSAVPTVANLARTFRIGPYPTVDLTPVALSLTGIAFGYALLRLELFGFSPATRRLGRRAAIDDVGVGVAVLDAQGRIVELNAEAESILGQSTAEAGRVPLTDLLGDGRDDAVELPSLDPFDASADGDSGDPADGDPGGRDDRRLVDIHIDEGRRTYEITASPVTGPEGTVVGRTVSLHDVTERERRRQRLEVLNRVLRHNLRNELTVVTAHASDLTDRLDGSTARQAALIEKSAATLTDLAENAQEVERILGGPDGATAPVDVAAIARSVVEEARAAHPDATITIETPPEARIEARAGVLEAVLANLVENAVVHHGGAPTVAVTVRAEEGVAVSVADDGPGIPEEELTPITAGTETALRHGSGLGLWLVRWGVDVLGGDLSFSDRPAGGTVVTVALGGADPPAPSDSDPLAVATDAAE